MTSTVSSAEPLVQGAFFKPCELSAPFNWQPGLLRKLDELRCMGQFCDVTIQVDDTIGDASFLPYMRVHSVIVAAGSPMLHEKLQDPSFAGSVLVAGVGVWQWEQVINFLYTGKVCLTASGQAEALVQAAIELKMEVLVNMLQDHLGPSDAAAVEDVKPLKSRQAADTSEPMDDDDEDNDADIPSPLGEVDNIGDLMKPPNSTRQKRKKNGRFRRLPNPLKVESVLDDRDWSGVQHEDDLDKAEKDCGNKPPTSAKKNRNRHGGFARKSKPLKPPPPAEENPVCSEVEYEDVDKMCDKIIREERSKISSTPKMKDEMITCNECNKRFFTKAGYDYHKCTPQSLDASEAEDVWEQYRCYEGETVEVPLPDPPCLICTETFSNRQLLKAHIKKQHGEDKMQEAWPPQSSHLPAKCPKCDTVQTFHKLPDHVWCIHGLRVKNHRRVSNSAYFKCPECGQRCAQLNAILRHVNSVHGGLRKHMCETCGKCVSSRSTLAEHRRTHTGERPYKCRYCPKSFKKRETVKNHEARHMDTKPYECNLCSKQFAQITSINLHFRNHHPSVSREDWKKHQNHRPLTDTCSDPVEVKELPERKPKQINDEIPEETPDEIPSPSFPVYPSFLSTLMENCHTLPDPLVQYQYPDNVPTYKHAY